MITFLSILWFIRNAKAISFWLYLWQLKEYHLGRFLDHFRTAKGKSIFWNSLFVGKIILFVAWFFWPRAVLFFLLLLYLGEVLQGARHLFKKTLLFPVPTAKIKFLIFSGLLREGIFLAIVIFFFSKFLVPALLAFDILLPLIVSLWVLGLQPFVALARNKIIAKARKKREEMKNFVVIGITGSYGKTSTKEFLAHILSKKFKVLKTKEHQNSEVGIAQCILQELRPEHEVFVCEMGAYNKGGIKLLASIAKPIIGVLTGINEQHMATFGSQENIIQAKYELIESLPPNGIAFFNAKNSYCVELYEKTNIKKILYGQAARFRGEENMLGAMAVAKELGMSEEEISGAVKEVENTFPGAQIKKGKGGITLIDATYSANPDGVMAGLEYLETFPGKKIIVMPCLIELGKASKEVHKRIGAKIAEVCDLAIIATKDRLEDIKEGAGGSEKILFLENSEEIVEKIRTFLRKNLDSPRELKSTTTSRLRQDYDGQAGPPIGEASDVVLLEGRISLEVQAIFFQP